MNSSASYYDAAALAYWLRDRIERKTPTCVLRLGDGEGNFLPYAPTYANYQQSDRREIQQQMWGEVFFTDAEAEAFTEELAAVALRADAVGVSAMNRLLKTNYRLASTSQRVVRGWHNVLHFFDAAVPESVRDKVVVSSYFHSDLHGWDLFPLIFEPISSVSIVSCHDLSEYLSEQFDVAVRRWHKIPAQKRHLDVFGHRQALESERFYPNVFNAIMSELAPLPGEVYVIAAGILGKFMCDRIRAKGGIAIDIGSLADYWKGFSTREYGRFQLTPGAPMSGDRTTRSWRDRLPIFQACPFNWASGLLVAMPDGVYSWSFRCAASAGAVREN